MKLHYLTLCAALAIPAAFAQDEPTQEQKHFGPGSCLPKFLEQYDVDGDGVINEEERQAMIEARKQIRDQMREGWDEDGDGKLNKQERQHAREQLRQLMEEKRTERFNEADTDGDGYISWEEFTALPGIADKLEEYPLFEEMAKLIFDRIDTDDDGLISLDEFLAIGHHGGGGHQGPGGGMGPGDGDGDGGMGPGSGDPS